jgi:predicted secreted protein
VQPFTYIAIYFIVWWVCLFLTLPFGVRTQHEDGAVTDGTEPGAPVNTYIWRKVLATTVISAFVTLLIFWGISNPALQAYWNR